MFNPFDVKKSHGVEVSPSIILFTVFFLLGIWFLFLIHNILLLLFLAFILMVALNPAVTKLEKKYRFPRSVAMVTVYLLVVFGGIGAIGLVIPPLVAELYLLVRTLNIPFIQEQIRNFTFSVSELNQLVGTVGSSLNVAFSLISSTFSSLFTVFTLMIMSFYLMLDRPHLHKKINWFTNDQRHIEKTKNFLDSLESQLGGWVRGQIILMVVIGIMTFVGLSLLSIPYALPLALMAGALEILPNLGPTISAVPAVIIAFIYLNPIMGGITILFYILVQQLENNLIVPKIMKDNADVNPLVAILSILIGFELVGVAGALLGVPGYIVLRAFYASWLKK